MYTGLLRVPHRRVGMPIKVYHSHHGKTRPPSILPPGGLLPVSDCPTIAAAVWRAECGGVIATAPLRKAIPMVKRAQPPDRAFGQKGKKGYDVIRRAGVPYRAGAGVFFSCSWTGNGGSWGGAGTAPGRLVFNHAIKGSRDGEWLQQIGKTDTYNYSELMADDIIAGQVRTIMAPDVLEFMRLNDDARVRDRTCASYRTHATHFADHLPPLMGSACTPLIMALGRSRRTRPQPISGT